MAASPAKPRGGLLRHPNFLKLWLAETVSVFGSQISGLAIPVVAVLLLHVSAIEVALLGTIEFLPFILFTLPAGAWVDRLRRRPIMIIGTWAERRPSSRSRSSTGSTRPRSPSGSSTSSAS